MRVSVNSLLICEADVEDFPTLTRAILAHSKEIPAQLEAEFAMQPHHPRLHSLKALMLVIAGRSEVLEAAQTSVIKAQHHARMFGCSKADAAFVAAADCAANGDWQKAIIHLEACLFHDPQDTLAAKLSHALRFMLGDKIGMLNSIRRVLSGLSPHHPHRGFMLGCLAFALEENGFYADAEYVGREAVLREPSDVWGMHAVSHVHEMTGQHKMGINWIELRSPQFTDCNNFSGHLFWHLALFKLETGAICEVFSLYDEFIRKEKTDDFRDISNAVSLLTRLELEGYSVGNRWEELADKAEARCNDHALVFADLHYLLALIGADRLAAARLLSRGVDGSSSPSNDQNQIAVKTGNLLMQGLIAFSEQRYSDAFAALSSSRPRYCSLGGSDAQRDMLEQILIEAALKTGEKAEAQRLLLMRLKARHGHNAFASERLKWFMSHNSVQ